MISDSLIVSEPLKVYSAWSRARDSLIVLGRRNSEISKSVCPDIYMDESESNNNIIESERRKQCFVERQLKSILPSTNHGVLTLKYVLVTLYQLHQTIQPFAYLCNKKCDLLTSLDSKGGLRVGTLYNYARRLAPHVRAPPEYADPTGANPYCVPGYMFPCPDQTLMLKALLFKWTPGSFTVSAVPPRIASKPHPTIRNSHIITFQTPTPNPTFVVGINQDPFQSFSGSDLPIVTAPGTYLIRVYCTAPNHMQSDCSVATIVLESDDKYESVQQALEQKPKPSVPASEKPSVFSGLFFKSVSDEEDEDEDDEDDS